MYADAARLLVFGAFLTSVSCVKKYFFDATESPGFHRGILAYFS